ncbi:NAD(P)-dependent oxidoreductase [Liquorilactobacillus hordei]|uniref:NAD(P)-dependent oxidoreductase n=1 Tax=Liquorilactobacillus hordei TaxID=468911 RepID=UPI0039EC03F2
MKILNLFNISPENKQRLKSLDGVELINLDDLKAYDYNQIDFVYGWNQRGDELLKKLTHVKFVQSISAGVDYLPLNEFKQRHILLANTSGIHAAPISETVVAYLLAFSRGIIWSDQFKEDHLWESDKLRKSVFSLSGQRALVYGTGNIGTAIAIHLHQLGLQVSGVNLHHHIIPEFDEILPFQPTIPSNKKFDYIINTMPLTSKTYHFFDDKFFSSLSNQPMFINVGRGASVDTSALITALTHCLLKSAAIDVFEEEPLPNDSPLWQLNNVLITPHISGASADYELQAFDIFWQNLNSFINTGHVSVNKVDLVRGY